MEAVVLIHGITGSKLAQQKGDNVVEIWPPDTSDLFGYSQAKIRHSAGSASEGHRYH
jgi:hypothetical protein